MNLKISIVVFLHCCGNPWNFVKCRVVWRWWNLGCDFFGKILTRHSKSKKGFSFLRQNTERNYKFNESVRDEDSMNSSKSGLMDLRFLCFFGKGFENSPCEKRYSHENAVWNCLLSTSKHPFSSFSAIDPFSDFSFL